MDDPVQIPETVWDEMSRARDLADDLATRARTVRFRRTPHRRVVADVRDAGGLALHDVPLEDVVDPARLADLLA